MKGRKAEVIGVAWYNREQWELLRDNVADPEEIEEDYEDWAASAERAIRQAGAAGIRFERITVDVADLIAWSQAEGRPLDGAARAEFAALQLRKLHFFE